MAARKLYCARCGTVAFPERKVEGSFALEIALWLMLLLPGLIYTLWRSGIAVCPACRSTELIPVDSPRARAAFAGGVPSTPSAHPAVAQPSPGVNRNLFPVLCILGFLSLCVIAISVATIPPENKGDQRQVSERMAEATTPEGRKATGRELAGRLLRLTFPDKIERTFLDNGVDIQCQLLSDDDKQMLVIGPAVNRVFVHQFLKVPSLVKNMRKIGFTKVTFWSGKPTDFSHDFIQSYDLTR